MDQDDRPSPEELLKAIQHQESIKQKGRLTIFLGMAAGVGKTYAMLESAQILQKRGVDLVVGVVNTHGRKETEAILNGLKILPLQKVQYKGIELEELDLDAILKLMPQLVLVDELPHTNAPGLRHAKRWQDVNEILEHGIDVHTTLNVQHIESLKDVVENIVGIKITETVPDSIIESAASIELVDLTPENLLQRLREGKVYLGDKSALAAENFFQEDRLTALREIVLRYAAEKVDHDLHEMVSVTKQYEKWKPKEKLLAAINQTPESQKLIRTARRLASRLDATWIAVYVNDGRTLSDDETKMLAKNLSHARDLGAEVITTDDPSICNGILRIARQQGVSQIILGQGERWSYFGLFGTRSLLSSLMKECKDIDIHVIGAEASEHTLRKKITDFSFQIQINPYLITLILVLILTAANWAMLPYIGYKIVGVFYLIGILLLSLFIRKGPIMFASVLCALIWDFFFIPPPGRFHVSTREDTAVLLLYFLTAISTGILVDRARENKKMLEKREETAQTLYDIIKEIATASSMNEAFKSVKERLDKLFAGTFEILVKLIDNGLPIDNPSELLSDEKELHASLWVFENGKEAGWSTDTLPMSQNLYIPLKGFYEIVGVLIYRPQGEKILTPEEKNFLYTVTKQLAIYIERSFSVERSKRDEQNRQVERMRTTILNRISMVFQQPLLVSQNAIKSLMDKTKGADYKQIIKEAAKIENSMEQLIEILGNISAMAQISEGLIPLKKRLHKIDNLIKECCASLEKTTVQHTVQIKISENMPLVSFDFDLIEMCLLNLISNAIYYSPLGSLIEIEAKQTERFIVISVADEGKGIPEDQLGAIFEKFYRLPDTKSRGIGLGLSLAKAVAEVHQGYLIAENRPIKGAIFSLFLPV